MKCKLTFPSTDTEELIRPLNESPIDERIILLFKCSGYNMSTLSAYKKLNNQWVAGYQWYTEAEIVADGCIGWVPEPVFTIIKD